MRRTIPAGSARLLPEATLAQAAALLARLQAAGLRVATAESCTGGLLGAALTHAAGASAVVEGGFVTYANAAKTALLGVDAGLIAAHGAVSEAVAAAMAEGALRRVAADLAISVTGIAGPGGATPGKPVGLVWFGLARRGGAVRTRSQVFGGDRAEVRAQAVAEALRFLDEGF